MNERRPVTAPAESGASAFGLLRGMLRVAQVLPMPVFVKDASLRWRYANPAARRLFGLHRYHYRGRTHASLMPPLDAASGQQSDLAALESRGLIQRKETYFGRSFRVYKYALRVDGGTALGIVSMAIETTELEAARSEGERLRDFYDALSEINQGIVRELYSDREDLFRNICRIVVSHTPVLIAAIATIDHEARLLNYTQQACRIADFPDLARVRLELDESSPYGRGTVGRAVRSHETVVVNDVLATPEMAPWHTLFKRYNGRSTAAIPVMVGDRVEAVLSVYSTEVNFFTPELVRLLQELANDVGFAIRTYEQRDRIRYLALIDPLTDLPNRVNFMDMAARWLTGMDSVRRAQLLLIDIADFKFHNDLLGHEVGDTLLRALGRRLLAAAGDSPLVGRLGSDEFAVLLTESGDGSETSLARALRAIDVELEHPFDVGLSEPLMLKTEQGTARFPEDGTHPEALMRRASMALQLAKRAGPGSRVAYSPALERRLEYRHQIRQQIDYALDSGEVIPHYQPQIDLRSGRVSGLEALARLGGRDGKLLEPGDFIEEVEGDRGLVRRLGLTMIEAVAADLPGLAEAGLGVPVAVNIGARHLLAPGFKRDVIDLLGRYPGLRSVLECEITETAHLGDLSRATETVAWLREQGLSVALDDFGSGFTSMDYLQHLAIRKIKLDQSFVYDLIDSPRDQAIVRAVVHLAEGLEIGLVAEGVANVALGELLRELGVHSLQGYAIAPPLPLASLSAWSAEWQLPETWRSA